MLIFRTISNATFSRIHANEFLAEFLSNCHFSAETIDLTIISDNTKCDLQLIAALQIIHWSLNAMSNTIMEDRSQNEFYLLSSRWIVNIIFSHSR